MSTSAEAVPFRQQVRSLRRRSVALLLSWWHAAGVVTQRPRAFVAPVTDVITPPAWLLGLTALGCAWAGVALDWNELIVAAFLLAILLAICVVFTLGGHQLAAAVDLSRSRVVVGEKSNGRLLITNTSERRSLPLVIELPVGRGSASFDLPSLAAGAEHEELFAIPTKRRAVLDLGPVRAVRTDPLFLLRRDQELTEPGLLHVHPRTVRIEGSTSGFIRDLEGQTIKKISNHDVAFHALREYVPGDDRRFVHWKSTARTGTLMVRQFEETRRSHLLVTLSCRLEDYADDDEFELAVSVAASLGAQTLRDGFTLSATTSVSRLRSDHPILLLDQFSGVDFEPAAPRLPDTVRRLTRDVTGASIAILICGSLVGSGEVRRARRQLPLDVRTIVVQVDRGAEAAVRVMPDVDLATIGQLDDLAGSMRRLSS